MTFEELKEQKKQNRDIALLMKRNNGIERSRLNLQKDFVEKYLFGDGSNKGILQVFEAFYQEAYLITGRDTSRPSLRTFSSSAWQTKFANAVRQQGDEDSPLGTTPSESMYTKDANGYAIQTINQASQWFLLNSDNGQNSAGYYSAGASVANAVGSAAALNTPTRYVTNFGTGLWGQRTADNEQIVNPLYPGTDPDPLHQYKYGNGTFDLPDYYNEPYRGNLISAIQSIIDNLTAHKTHLETVILPIVTAIENGTNTLFTESNMVADSPTIASVNSVISTIDGHLTTMQGHLTYFSGFSALNSLAGQPGYVRATFDTRFQTTLVADVNAVRSFWQSRSSSISGVFGGNNVTSGLRKWRYFWISQLIQKPQSQYVALEGMNASDTQVNSMISKAEVDLQGMSLALTEYVGKPKISAVFFNPQLHPITKVLIQNQISVLFNTIPSSNVYKIMRRALPIPFDENEWSDGSAFISYVTSQDSVTQLIKQLFNDTSYLANVSYVYRVVAYDTNATASDIPRIGSLNTGSKQSSLFRNDLPVTSVSVDRKSVTVTGLNDLSNGAVVCVKFASSWFYTRCTGILDQEIFLETAIPAGTVLSISHMPSLFLA